MNLGSVHDFVHGFVHGVLNNVLLENDGLPFILNLDFEHSVVLEAFMVKYTVFFHVLSTLTWDTLLTLGASI